MTYQVIIPESVYLELKETGEYYESKQEDLGMRFVLNWDIAVSYLKTSPLIYQKKRKNLRTVKINKFPYLLVFEVIGSRVYVYRLIYASKNPKKIFKR